MLSINEMKIVHYEFYLYDQENIVEKSDEIEFTKNENIDANILD